MKTPDEIKKGLERCSTNVSLCDDCIFSNENVGKWKMLMSYALTYIIHLESRLAQVERERDAMLAYLSNSTFVPCDICKHDVDGAGVMRCKRIRELKGKNCVEWRGVCEENTKEE